MTFEQIIIDTRIRVADVEAMPDDAPHKAEVLEVLRGNLEAFEALNDNDIEQD